MSNLSRSRAEIVPLFLTACAVASPAWAQVAPAPQPLTTTASGTESSGATAANTSGSEIVVTARRRAESVQSVPVAVTVIGGDQLRANRVTQAEDLRFLAPNLQTQAGFTGRQSASFFIRGQGQAYGGSLPGVITYFSEVPLDPAGGAAFALFDLQSTQVLRGPQGTLFGRNTNGGAVLLTPVPPGPDLSAFVDGSFGNLDLRDIRGAISLPITSNLGVRLSGQILRRRGFTRNIALNNDLDNQHSESWRVFARWEPLTGVRNDLIYAETRADENSNGYVLTDVRTPSPITAYDPKILAYLAAQRAMGPRQINAPSMQGNARAMRLIINTASVELGDITLKNIFSRSHVRTCYSEDSDASPASFQINTCIINPFLAQTGIPIGPEALLNQYTDEFQVQGKSLDKRLDWIVGAFYLSSRSVGGVDVFRAFRVAKSGAFATVSTANIDDRSIALFGQGTYAFGGGLEGLKLTAGLRYTWDKRATNAGQMLSVNDGASFSCAAPGKAAATPYQQCFTVFRGKFEKLGYTVSLDYQASPRLLAYVASRRGFKSGGFNAITQASEVQFAPEVLTDVEVGVKSDWSIGGLSGRFNADYYYGWYSNIQRQVIAVVAGNTTTLIRSAGKGSLSGVELEGSVRFTPHIELSGFYAYSIGKYNGGFFDAGINVSGSPFPALPKHNGSATLRVSYPLAGDMGEIAASAQVYAQSKTAFSADVIRYFEAISPGYAILNARVEWNNAFGKEIDLSVWGRNVTNKLYETGGSAIGAATGNTIRLYGEPRTYGVSLGYKF